MKNYILNTLKELVTCLIVIMCIRFIFSYLTNTELFSDTFLFYVISYILFFILFKIVYYRNISKP